MSSHLRNRVIPCFIHGHFIDFTSTITTLLKQSANHNPSRFPIKNCYLQNISSNRNRITNVCAAIIIVDPFFRMLLTVLNELLITVIEVSTIDKEAIMFFAEIVQVFAGGKPYSA